MHHGWQVLWQHTAHLPRPRRTCCTTSPSCIAPDSHPLTEAPLIPTVSNYPTVHAAPRSRSRPRMHPLQALRTASRHAGCLARLLYASLSTRHSGASGRNGGQTTRPTRGQPHERRSDIKLRQQPRAPRAGTREARPAAEQAVDPDSL